MACGAERLQVRDVPVVAGVKRSSPAVTYLFALALAACGPPEERAAAKATAEVGGGLPVRPADAEAAVVTLGGGAATELASTLVARLQAAIEEEGAAGALGSCSEEGLPLTAAVAAQTGFEIRRTSLRVRNPANAPDSLERRALEFFHERVDAGEVPPAELVQRQANGDYRYYRPLVVQPFCVECHGPASELAEGVPQAIAERYPEDRATGYVAGDLRGVIRVTVPAEAVRAWTPPQRQP